MLRVPNGRLPAAAIALVAVGAALLIALALRLPDASQPVMPAEDPYSHMTLVREHLRDGNLDPMTGGGVLYPPGLHGVMAAWWAFSGSELYDLMRFGPVLFGLVSVAGLALLLGRWEGTLAAFAGALALAAMPEQVARTTMMSPTALDLALLPFLVGAVLEVLRGRLGWLAAAVPITGFLVIAHPWILAILGAAGVAFLVLYVLFPWRASRGAPVTRQGVAAVVALLGGALGLALATRWEASGTGFGELALPLAGHSAGMLGLMGVAVALGIAAFLFALPRMTSYRLPKLNQRPRPTVLQVLGVLAMGALLVAITWPALGKPMPDLVELPRMIGWPVLALAVLALLVLPVAGGPVAHAGAALFLVTYPLTIHNPLDSPYWPHRTVVFAGLAAAILVGVAAQRIVDAWRARENLSWPSWLPARGRARSLTETRSGVSANPLVLAVPALLVGVVVGAALVTGTPGPYNDGDGWDRYYNQCEFDNLRAVAALSHEDPKTLILTGSWQSKLVISAFALQGDRVWYKSEFFRPSYDYDRFYGHLEAAGDHAYLVVDRYLPQEEPDADLGFLDSPPWELVKRDCRGQGEMPDKFSLYKVRSE